MTLKKTLKSISFSAVAVLIVMMAAATVVEKVHGTPQAMRLCYHSPLFIALWAIAAGSGTLYLLAGRTGRRPFTVSLHLSLVLILIGALITFATGERGTVKLEQGVPATEFMTSDGHCRPLPLPLTLSAAEVEYYQGSTASSDYRSVLSAGEGERQREYTISMNRIARIRGYRFYQTGMDPQAATSVLSVSHDPWGTGITYAGYLWLLISMAGFFFERGSRLRSALRRLASTAAVLLLVPAVTAGARDRHTSLPVVPDEVARCFDSLYVYYNDRVAPMQTLTRDYCLKAYGKAHCGPYSAAQAVTGWLWYYDSWQDVPLKIKVRDRGTAREAEKTAIRLDAASGNAFRIFPLRDAEGVLRWYSCDDALPPGTDYDLWLFVRKSLDLVQEKIAAADWEGACVLLRKIRLYQDKSAAGVLPAASKIRAERLYNRIGRPLIPFMASITLGLVLFVGTVLGMARGCRPRRRAQIVPAILSWALWAYLTVVLGLRWYASGHAPLAGSYSVMMLMAWMASLVTSLSYRRFPLIQPMGFIVAGFTMLMASLSGANPQITHLMPVLQSPLLGVHVLCMMLSYTLLALVALNGIAALILRSSADRLQDISLVILYPAVFLLIAGTFLGAVWANISWGSYWSWDPKETWALITILVYSAALHGGPIKAMRRPEFFHAWCILALVCVAVTYFGVNLILGGMHSYA